MKKYKLTDETIHVFGHTLHRIEALADFFDIHKGDKGALLRVKKIYHKLVIVGFMSLQRYGAMR